MRRVDVLVMVADRRQEVGNVVVVEPVVGVSALAADGDKPGLAKEAKLLRSRARCQPGTFGEFLDAALAAEHRPEEPEAAACPEGAHCFSEGIGLLQPEWSSGGSVFEWVWHRAPHYIRTTVQT